MSKMNVPFVDLKAQLRPIREQVMSGIESVLDRTNFILGDDVSKLEISFAQYTGAQFAVGVSSGLDAIHLALRALGIGPGDEVLVPVNTFIATALGVTMTGATPIPVDINESDFLINPEKAEKAITPKTKAILPVHLYGRMVDVKPLAGLARKYNLQVVEDAAQAHGAELNGQRAGSVGAMGCFSFYPGKNLGCYGDGGMVTTNDSKLKDTLLALRNYGSSVKYHHPVVGFNNRLDTIQAAVLNVKLPHLDEYNNARYRNAQKYGEALLNVGDLKLPEIPVAGSHTFHLYVIRTQQRDALLEYLNKNGIQAGIHYPTPIHLHGAYKSLNYKKGDFPVGEKICDEILSLPMFPELSDEQIVYVADTVKSFFRA